MRIVGVLVGLIGGIAMLYFTVFVFGSVFDTIAFNAGTIVMPGHGDWVINIVSQFDLIYTCCLGISIALIIWGILSAVRVGEYTREY